METEVSLQLSEWLGTVPYPEPHKHNENAHTILIFILILSFYLLKGLLIAG
jgi:hypothetical protein